MTQRFEFFVALRYLMAKRKQAVISIITAISVVGVAAGVAALVIAMAITTGFRNTLERNLLGVAAHVMVKERVPEFGIADWREKAERLSRLPHVTQAAPSLYATVMFTGANSTGGFLRGILPPGEAAPPHALAELKEGSFGNWEPTAGGYPPIVLGSKLANYTGMRVGSIVQVLSSQGVASPLGPRPAQFSFRVTGIFESGFFDLDNYWAFASLESVQKVLSVDGVVNAIDLTLDDVYRAPEVARAAEAALGPELGATHWMEQNSILLGALWTERVVAGITIGLIEMVAALNILISLVMMVMEKHRDIAILVSMGARREQIRSIFMLQGVLIGLVGTTIGLAAGFTLSYLADRQQWIGLPEAVYSMRFVPFEPRLVDGIWISAAALTVSFLATLYPARAATRIAPAEALRYE